MYFIELYVQVKFRVDKFKKYYTNAKTLIYKKTKLLTKDQVTLYFKTIIHIRVNIFLIYVELARSK